LHAEAPLLKRSHLPKEILESAERSPSSPAAAPSAPPRGNAAANDAKLTPEERAALWNRLLAALDEHDGVIARAAESVGISRQAAYRLAEGFGYDADALRVRYPRHPEKGEPGA